MAQTVRLNSIRRDGSLITITFGKVQMEFSSLQSLREWVREVDTVENARRLCLAYLMERSADGTNISSVQNRTFRVDMGAVNPITVT